MQYAQPDSLCLSPEAHKNPNLLPRTRRLSMMLPEMRMPPLCADYTRLPGVSLDGYAVHAGVFPARLSALRRTHLVKFDSVPGSFKTTLDHHKLFVYHIGMIRNFASTETEQFFASGKSRRLPPDILKRAAMRLTQLDAATRIEDLRLPPSNRLEALSHDRAGQWSIRINDQWRVCFRFEHGDAYDVEIADYH